MKLICILISSLVFLIFVFPQPFFLEPQAFAGSASKYGPDQHEEVFTAVVNSFALFSSLLNEVNYQGESIYPIVTKARNSEEAAAYLREGFQAELAESMANYYLGWDEELAKLVVIPTDSIPLITMADREQTNIVFITEHHAVVQRTYQNCYAEQNSYVYTIHMQKESAGWKISELSLEEIK